MYSDDRICVEGQTRNDKFYQFKKVNHKQSGGLKILKAMRINASLSGEQLKTIGGYASVGIARNQVKKLFARIADDLEIDIAKIFRGENGYRIICNIREDENPAP